MASKIRTFNLAITGAQMFPPWYDNTNPIDTFVPITLATNYGRLSLALWFFDTARDRAGLPAEIDGDIQLSCDHNSNMLDYDLWGTDSTGDEFEHSGQLNTETLTEAQAKLLLLMLLRRVYKSDLELTVKPEPIIEGSNEDMSKVGLEKSISEKSISEKAEPTQDIPKVQAEEPIETFGDLRGHPDYNTVVNFVNEMLDFVPDVSMKDLLALIEQALKDSDRVK